MKETWRLPGKRLPGGFAKTKVHRPEQVLKENMFSQTSEDSEESKVEMLASNTNAFSIRETIN